MNAPTTPSALLAGLGSTTSPPSAAGCSGDQDLGDLCNKCQEPLTGEDARFRKRSEHRGCWNNYKVLTRRWSKDPAVKLWWEAMSSDAQVAWYRKSRELLTADGANRKLDIQARVVEKQEAGQTTQDKGDFIPYEERMLPKVVSRVGPRGCLGGFGDMVGHASGIWVGAYSSSVTCGGRGVSPLSALLGSSATSNQSGPCPIIGAYNGGLVCAFMFQRPGLSRHQWLNPFQHGLWA